MNTYDPLHAPNPDEWQALDEDERLALVRQYHRTEDDLPDEANAELHAVCHVTIENQVALGDETPVADTLDRLMDEGLDRHDAIHAIAGVFMEHLMEQKQSMQEGGTSAGDFTDAYYEDVKDLTAQQWLNQAPRR
jgi:hypothetical protein